MSSNSIAPWYLIVGAVGLLYGCAATTRSHRESSGLPLTLTVQVSATDRSQIGSRPIAPNETLHTGDALFIKAKVNQPAYVYAVLYSEKGLSMVLSLGGKASLVQPGSIVKIPEEDAAELDSNVGDEQIVVVALPHPIDAATCDLLRIPCPSRTEQILTRGGESPPPPPRPPPPSPPPPPRTPPGVGPGERNGLLGSDSEQHQVQVQSDATGKALLRFTFKHVP